MNERLSDEVKKLWKREKAKSADLLAACEAALPLLKLLGVMMSNPKNVTETVALVGDAVTKAKEKSS